MPQLPFSQLLTANQLAFNPISGWQYEYLPWPASVILLMRTAGAAAVPQARATVYSGSETIQERAPIQAGGTAGTTPSELNTAAISWIAAQGDRIKVTVDEAQGVATTTLDGLIIVNPMF